MSDLITPELFDYLVELAALELAPDEAGYLRSQLNRQLKAIQELERIALPDDVPPAAHGVSFPDELRPGLRPDETQAPTTADLILAQAPETDERYFVAPEIPTTEL